MCDSWPMVDLHSHLCGILALLRVVSLTAERSHLYGQELKPKRSCGIGVDASTLSQVAYLRSVVSEAKALGAHITKEVLDSHGIGLAQCQALSRALRLDDDRRGNSSGDRGNVAKEITKEAG